MTDIKKDIYDIENNPKQALDQPDPRDYQYTDIYWSFAGTTPESDLNKKLRLALAQNKFAKAIDYLDRHQIIENQYVDEDTKKSCTRQGIVNVYNAQWLLQYLIEWIDDYEHISAKPMRMEHEKRRYDKYWIEYWSLGSTIQSALQQAKEWKYLAGYADAPTVNDAIDAINRLHFIYTGSNNWLWSAIGVKWTYKRRTDWKRVWHAFAWAVAYDLEWKFFWGIDSSWRRFFKIPFREWNTLYTRYACIREDDDKLRAYKEARKKEANKKVYKQRHAIFDETIVRDWIMWNEIAKYPWIQPWEVEVFRENTHWRANIMRALKKKNSFE